MAEAPAAAPAPAAAADDDVADEAVKVDSSDSDVVVAAKPAAKKDSKRADHVHEPLGQPLESTLACIRKVLIPLQFRFCAVYFMLMMLLTSFLIYIVIICNNDKNQDEKQKKHVFFCFLYLPLIAGFFLIVGYGPLLTLGRAVQRDEPPCCFGASLPRLASQEGRTTTWAGLNLIVLIGWSVLTVVSLINSWGGQGFQEPYVLWFAFLYTVCIPAFVLLVPFHITAVTTTIRVVRSEEPQGPKNRNLFLLWFLRRVEVVLRIVIVIIVIIIIIIIIISIIVYHH
jgi:hypothetical protein